MVTKAQVIGIGKNTVSVKIINWTNNVNWTDNLNITCSINTFPGITSNLQSGDYVYVAFEDNLQSKPVVLGMWQNDNTKNRTVNATLSNLTLTDGISIKDSVKISNKEISTLKGINVNKTIQKQIDDISKSVTENKKNLDKINTLFNGSNFVLPTGSYGSGKPPSNAKEGQIYLKII